MAKGWAVVSGSNTVISRILEDGQVKFGVDTQVSASISGSLVLELGGTEGANKYLTSNTVGSASWATIAASEVTVTPGANVTSSNVQDAIIELSNDMAGISGSGGSGSLNFSDGGVSELIQTDGLSTVTFTGSANQITSSYNSGNNTFTFSLTNNVTIPNDLTVTNDLTVSGDLNVLGSTTNINTTNILVDDPLILLASGNVGDAVDQGLILSRSAGNRGVIWDESADEFALVETTEDGTTAGNITISAYSPLRIGNLNAAQITASSGLSVTGQVTLPAASITNSNLQNSQVRIDIGNGLTSSLGDPFDLALGGTGSFAVDFGANAGQVAAGSTIITVSGTVGEIEVNATTFDTITIGAGGTVTIGLPDDVTIANDLTVGNNLMVTGSSYLGTDGNDEILLNGKFRIPVFVSGSIPSGFESAPETFHGQVFYLSGSGQPAGQFQVGNKWYFNENGTWYKSFFTGV